MAFAFRYTLNGGPPLILPFLFKDTETLTVGDLVNVETGEIDLAATNDTGLAGQFMGAEDPNDSAISNPGVVAGTDSTTWGLAIVNPDAVYGTADANARAAGATLDLAGATGAQTVATSSNVDLVVVQSKKNTSDETLVVVAHGEHYLRP